MGSEMCIRDRLYCMQPDRSLPDNSEGAAELSQEPPFHVMWCHGARGRLLPALTPTQVELRELSLPVTCSRSACVPSMASVDWTQLNGRTFQVRNASDCLAFVVPLGTVLHPTLTDAPIASPANKRATLELADTVTGVSNGLLTALGPSSP